jgi:hypothetical protein
MLYIDQFRKQGKFSFIKIAVHITQQEALKAAYKMQSLVFDRAPSGSHKHLDLDAPSFVSGDSANDQDYYYKAFLCRYARLQPLEPELVKIPSDLLRGLFRMFRRSWNCFHAFRLASILLFCKWQIHRENSVSCQFDWLF